MFEFEVPQGNHPKTKIWIEKYRPSSLEDYVGNQQIVEKAKQWAEDPASMPHLLFSGHHGTGKTTIGKIIAKAVSGQNGVLYLNASSNNSVDDVRNTIIPYASQVSLDPGKVRVVFLDEFDRVSIHGQDALKGVFEEFYENTRFIMTCNTPERIIGPIREGRVQQFEVQSLDPKQAVKRAMHILTEEKIEYDPRDVARVVKKFFPDMRSVIQTLQRGTNGSTFVLDQNLKDSEDHSSSLYKILTNKQLEKKKRFREIRQYCQDHGIRNYFEIIKGLEKNCLQAGADEISLIMAIAEWNSTDGLCVDKELNFAAFIANIIENDVI